MISRRTFLGGVLAGLGGIAGGAGYAFGIEPRLRLVATHYSVTPAVWPAGLKLRLAVLADIHAAEPFMSAERIEEIVDHTNSLNADAVLLLGDYSAGIRKWRTAIVPSSVWAGILGRLRAPLGVHAVLGNHDWWDDYAAQRRGAGPVYGRVALENAGIAVYENDAVRLEKDGQSFWLAGLGDQLALLAGTKRWGRPKNIGVDDLPGTLSKITDDGPVILMAHEPDIFPRVPDRLALTVSGHTHGGQVRLFGYSPVVPSRFHNRYAYGQVEENGRTLIVSGGLGCSIVPVRFGVPPEIVVIDLEKGERANV